MAILSFVLSLVSLIGYAIFIYLNASSGWIFFSAAAASVISIGLGLIARRRPWARAGITLGIIDAIIGIALFLWLAPSPISAWSAP